MRPIIWHKWTNPLRIPAPENELNPSEIETRDSFSYSDENSPKEIPNKFIGALSISQLGIVPVWSSSQADDIFNFWVGQTSFIIKDIDRKRIESLSGVEEFTQLTPYRFRIAIAKHPMFKPEEVKKNIEDLFDDDKKQ